MNVSLLYFALWLLWLDLWACVGVIKHQITGSQGNISGWFSYRVGGSFTVSQTCVFFIHFSGVACRVHGTQFLPRERGFILTTV